jgi:hypothetical protein
MVTQFLAYTLVSLAAATLIAYFDLPSEND